MKFLRIPKKNKKKNIEIDEKSLKEKEDCFNACIDNSIFYTRLAFPAAFFMGHLFFLGGVNTFDNILIGLALFSFVFFSTTILYTSFQLLKAHSKKIFWRVSTSHLVQI